ncbi:zinc-ribbon domain-containing protein [[Eubacterium] cellulosolvens]
MRNNDKSIDTSQKTKIKTKPDMDKTEYEEVKVHCQNCGKPLEPGTNFCPVCGKPIAQQFYQPPWAPPMQPAPNQYPQALQGSGKSLAAGILILIASGFCLVEGTIIYCIGVFRHWGWWYNPIWDHWGWVAIILIVFAYWGFAIGLTGGILTLKRTKFPLAIIGSTFVIVSGCLAFLGTFYFGILILVLGILGTVFTAIARNEFR